MPVSLPLVCSFILLLPLANSVSPYANRSLSLPRQSVLPRKRRYLAFSDKSNFLMTITLLKATEYDKRLNTLHEIDVPFPLPRNWFALKYNSHRKDRSILYSHLESVLDLFGFNGRNCMLKILCEVDKMKPKLVNSLTLELIRSLFSSPTGDFGSDYDHALNETCGFPCSLSFLGLINK